MPETTPLDGAVEEVDGRYALRFERRFAHPVEHVWDALTRPERITEWFIIAGEVELLELVEGGRYVIRTTGPPEFVEAHIAAVGDAVTHWTVVRVEPQRVFAIRLDSDPDNALRWELERDGDGCRLVFTHTMRSEPQNARAGDQMCLELLAESLDGRAVDWRPRLQEYRDRLLAHRDGTVEEVDGRTVLRFERRFAHRVERVWEALTRPEQLTRWTGEGEVELELVEGGRFDVRTTGPHELVEAIVAEGGGEEGLVRHDTVLRVEPPHLFEHTFHGAGSLVRWELRPDGDGCVLVLTHTLPGIVPAEQLPLHLAGWHELLELLGRALDGRPAAWSRREWDGYRDMYAARLGR